ncbi:hypothetical protein ACFL0I_04975, partial [Gemmatimonadota bacterium]
FYVMPFVEEESLRERLDQEKQQPKAPDGSELYYRATNGQLVAAEIIPSTTFVVGERTELFPFRGMYSSNYHAQYDVHPDGDRFLMIQLGDPTMISALVVVENFTVEPTEGSGS